MKISKKVLLVYGGKSKERKVSILTGNACLRALKKLGFKVIKFDPKNKNFTLIDKNKVDLIFNALHGKDGEDGVAQSFFEYLGIPYTHSGVISSMIAMDKIISKEIFIKNKILTPKYFVVNKDNYSIKNLKKLFKSLKTKSSIVVKPVNEGSSIGVKICSSFNKLKNETNKLFKTYNKLIFEEFIDGQEIQVAVLNNKALGAIELKPKRKFYDYKAKYEKSSKTKHIMPADLTKKKYMQILKISEKAHKALSCRGVTRSDFKFFNDKFYMLEINTQPGMTNLSLVPEIAKYKKISFINLVKKITDDAGVNK
jgi:D-alanine-D-alanine ligase